jgi:hypothetical protein
MLARRARLAAAACVIGFVAFAAVAVLYWHSRLGPELMLRAIKRGDVQTITSLANTGISPDSDVVLVGGLMHCAAASGQIDSMARLHDLGASLNRVDGYGATPLHVAIQARKIESLKWLIAHGADASIHDREGRTVAGYIQTEIPVQQQRRFFDELRGVPDKTSQSAGSRR